MADSQIAVIVPVYNNENTIRRAADSVLNQTEKDLQLILVDDGSQDGTGAICDEYARKDVRVKVFHKQNEGLMATWMRGVKESTAPYLCFLDADDWVEPEMLETMKKSLADSVPRQIVCCSYVIDREWNGTSEKKTHAVAPGVYEGEKLRTQIKERILGNEDRTVILSRCMKLFSRELIENNMQYCNPSISMGEDLNITVPAILDTERVVLLDQAWFYHYIYVSDSMVHRYDAGMYNNIVLLRDTLLRILSEKEVRNAEQMAQKEFFYLFLVEMKNELRRIAGRASTERPIPTERAITGRIRKICLRENSPKMAAEAGEVYSPANKLIVWMMRKPDYFRIQIVRTAFLLDSPSSRKTGYGAMKQEMKRKAD